MKNFLALAASFLLLTGTPAFAQWSPNPPGISVSGSAEVKVAPDEVYLNVGVQSRDEKLENAVQQNNAQVAKALDFLKGAGVPAKDVQTDYINVTPVYRNETDATPAVYTARKSIQVKLTDLGKMEPILTGLLANGINHVHGIDFRTTQLRRYRDEARALATRAAKEKATAIATELGTTLDKVSNISVNDFGGTQSASSWGQGGRYGGGMAQNSVQNEGGNSDTDNSNLSIGQISVSATVNVSFGLK